MSKINPTNFVLNQWVGACRHTPLRGALVRVYNLSLGSSAGAAAVGGLHSGQGSSSLSTTTLSEEEVMKNIVEGRLVFAVRPPSNVVIGCFVGAWNVVVGLTGAPILALGSALHALASTPDEGRVPKPVRLLANVCVRAPLVGVGFASLGVLTGAHQAAFGAFNQIRAPIMRLATDRYWSNTECDFVSPSSLSLSQPAAAGAALGAAAVVLERSQRACEYASLSSEDILLKAVKRNNDRAKEKEEERTSSGDRWSEKKSSSPASREYYSILGVSETATTKQIKEAFSIKAMKLHPDKNPRPNAHEEFDQLTKAYRTLSNPSKRKQYDATGGRVKDGNGGEDDMAQKKREAIRMFFGGDQLMDLVGDVRRNNFNRRFIDDADFKPADLAVYNERMEDACVQELLTAYLEGFPAAAVVRNPAVGSDVIRISDVNSEIAEWQTRVRRMVSTYSNVGLARQVLHTVAVEYERVLIMYGDAVQLYTGVKCAASSALLEGRRSVSNTATRYATDKLPNTARHTMEKLKAALTLNPSAASTNPSLVLDFIWRLSVTELEQSAHRIALRAIRDVSVSPEERHRRQVALAELTVIFKSVGLVYTAVDKRIVDRMSESIRDYQVKRQQQRGGANK